jgi:hypothetical protein
MSRPRWCVPVLCSGMLLVAGCADTSVSQLPTSIAHQAVVTTGSIANSDADLIMARAIAEHEMRRP